MPTVDPLTAVSPASARHGDGGRPTTALPAAPSRRTPALHPRELGSSPCHGDPTIAALLRLVAAPPDGVDAGDGESLDGGAGHWTADEVDELADRLDASVRDAQRLSAQIERAESELQRLRDRTRRLADALGACDSCWGEDSGCPECQGCGRPGRSLPDERLFAEIVMPAVRLVRLCDLRPVDSGPARVSSCTPNGHSVANLYANALRGRGLGSR
jgi:hypothetical protein